MRLPCRIAAAALERLQGELQPGMTTAALSAACISLIREQGGTPAMRGFLGYPADLCVSVNNVATHGIPSDYPLQEGDIVTVDVVVESKGWYADTAATYIVGRGSPDVSRLWKAAQAATAAGIAAACPPARIGDIGSAIEKTARRYGCRVLTQFVGHGIGRGIHEEPVILHTGTAGTGRPLVPGMVFTVEPILTLGAGETKLLQDGWTQVTVDNGLTAQFEHTIALSSRGVEVLTKREGEK